MKKKKLVLILSGGGAKGAFQVGAWNRIIQDGIRFDQTHLSVTIPNAVFGISAGAMNGAMIAMGKFKELLQLWNRIAGNPNQIFTSQFLKRNDQKIEFDSNAFINHLAQDLNILDKSRLMFKATRHKTFKKILNKLANIDALASNAPLAHKLSTLLSRSEVKSEVFKAGFVSLTDGNYHSLNYDEFSNDKAFQNAVLASSSIPMLWSPVANVQTYDYELSHLVDGGIRNSTPLADAVQYIESCEEDAEYHFLIISCHTPSLDILDSKPNLFTIAGRTLYDISLNEVQSTDLSEFLRINELVEQADSKGCSLYSKSGRKLKSFKVKVIQPQRNLSDGLDFSRSAVMDSFAHGYQVAKNLA